MNTEFSLDSLQVNETIDAHGMLLQMGYQPDAIVKDGKLLRVFCPIHKDQIRRSLILDTEEKYFNCQYTQCPAHTGGPLVALYAICMDMTLTEAANRLRAGVQTQVEPILLEKAQALIEQQNYGEAMNYLLQAREEFPENTITRCKIASLHLERGDRDAGFREYMAAAEEFGVKGDLDKTLSIYNMLMMMAPTNERVRRQMAYLYGRLGRPRDAADLLKLLIDQYIQESNPNQVVRICEELVELLPQDAQIRAMLTEIYAGVGQNVRAAKECETAAHLYMEEGNRSAALDILDWLVENIPGQDHLVELRYKLHTEQPGPTPETTQATAESVEPPDEGGWGDFAADLEAELDATAGPTYTPQELTPDDARITMCRQQLEGMSALERYKLKTFLADTVSEVKANYRNGLISPTELDQIRSFYRAFSIAKEQIDAERKA